VLLQCLSVVTLGGTFIVVIDIARQGQQLFGVTAPHDPVPWIILAAGVIASLIFAGLGYSLAMLCALYDRQVSLKSALGALGSLTPKPQPSTERRAAPALDDAPSNVAPPTIPNVIAAPATTPLSKPAAPQGGLWKALTKERHFRKQLD
jgi:hypothetical protein